MGDKVGASTTVTFPVGTGGKGNSGVAAVVSSTPGAIGNNSWFYIRQAGLKAVAVENNAGKFVYPYEPYLVAAASLLKKVPNLNTLSGSTANTIATGLSIVDAPYSKPKKGAKPSSLQKNEAAAYPLATFTYVIARPDDSNISLVQQFITFALSSAEQKKGRRQPTVRAAAWRDREGRLSRGREAVAVRGITELVPWGAVGSPAAPLAFTAVAGAAPAALSAWIARRGAFDALDAASRQLPRRVAALHGAPRGGALKTVSQREQRGCGKDRREEG